MTTEPIALPDAVRALMSRNSTDGSTVLDQAVRWKPANWHAPRLQRSAAVAAEHSSPGDDGELLLDRRHVLKIASSVDDPVVSFVAAMIWGHGVRGYGARRVDDILAAAGKGLNARLDGIAAAARQDAAAAWDAFTTTHKLAGLGPAFGSKFAYFVAFAEGLPKVALPPLIVDLNTSWAMWDLVQLARSVERRDGYLDYVRLVMDWAGSDWRPDEIEWALFKIGRNVPRQVRPGSPAGCHSRPPLA